MPKKCSCKKFRGGAILYSNYPAICTRMGIANITEEGRKCYDCYQNNYQDDDRTRECVNKRELTEEEKEEQRRIQEEKEAAEKDRKDRAEFKKNQITFPKRCTDLGYGEGNPGDSQCQTWFNINPNLSDDELKKNVKDALKYLESNPNQDGGSNKNVQIKKILEKLIKKLNRL